MSALKMIGVALLFEVGIVDVEEARYLLDLPGLTVYRKGQLARAAQWTMSRAFRLPGYCLHSVKPAATKQNEEDLN